MVLDLSCDYRPHGPCRAAPLNPLRIASKRYQKIWADTLRGEYPPANPGRGWCTARRPAKRRGHARVSRPVLQSENDLIPVAGLTVLAKDSEGRTISSIGKTDSTGRFQLFFWPNSAGQVSDLKIVPSSVSGAYPGLDRSFRVPDPDPEVPAIASSQTYYMGSLPPIRWMQGSVLGNRPLAGTELRFRGEIADGIYRYDVAHADVEGRFSAYLYPGRYTVDIIPPIGSRYRYSRVSGDILSVEELAFRPSSQATVTGRIIAPGGVPIAGATVESTLVKAAFSDPRLARPDDAPPTRTQRVQTDLDGNYLLDLDPGTHDLRVIAPTEYGLPPLTRTLDITPIDQNVSGIDIQMAPSEPDRRSTTDSHVVQSKALWLRRGQGRTLTTVRGASAQRARTHLDVYSCPSRRLPEVRS